MIGKVLISYIEKRDFVVLDFLYKYLRLMRVYKKKLVWLDEVQGNKLNDISKQLTCVSFSPVFNEGRGRKYNSNITISLYKFNKTLINIRSSSFYLISDDFVILERVPNISLEFCNYSTGFVRVHNELYALLRFNKKSIKLNRVFFLGGNGCFNYYHWLVEIIPRLLLVDNDVFKKYAIDYIVCDSSVRDIVSYRRLLEIVLNSRGITTPIFYIEKNCNLYAESVFYINSANNVVFNTKNILSSVEYSFFSIPILKDLREILMKSIPSKKVKKSKIFLARKKSQLRSYNQEEIIEYLGTQGFEAVYLDDLALEEQILLFNQADFIIGPSGAAWSNIIFCKKGCKAISWLSAEMSEFSVFSSLAKIFDCDMNFFIIDQVDNFDNIHSNYMVDLSKLKELYAKMII